jgi:hypothetical protein
MHWPATGPDTHPLPIVAGMISGMALTCEDARSDAERQAASEASSGITADAG